MLQLSFNIVGGERGTLQIEKLESDFIAQIVSQRDLHITLITVTSLTNDYISEITS